MLKLKLKILAITILIVVQYIITQDDFNERSHPFSDEAQHDQEQEETWNYSNKVIQNIKAYYLSSINQSDLSYSITNYEDNSFILITIEHYDLSCYIISSDWQVIIGSFSNIADTLVATATAIETDTGFDIYYVPITNSKSVNDSSNNYALQNTIIKKSYDKSSTSFSEEDKVLEISKDYFIDEINSLKLNSNEFVISYKFQTYINYIESTVVLYTLRIVIFKNLEISSDLEFRTVDNDTIDQIKLFKADKNKFIVTYYTLSKLWYNLYDTLDYNSSSKNENNYIPIDNNNGSSYISYSVAADKHRVLREYDILPIYYGNSEQKVRYETYNINWNNYSISFLRDFKFDFTAETLKALDVKINNNPSNLVYYCHSKKCLLTYNEFNIFDVYQYQDIELFSAAITFDSIDMISFSEDINNSKLLLTVKLNSTKGKYIIGSTFEVDFNNWLMMDESVPDEEQTFNTCPKDFVFDESYNTCVRNCSKDQFRTCKPCNEFFHDCESCAEKYCLRCFPEYELVDNNCQYIIAQESDKNSDLGILESSLQSENANNESDKKKDKFYIPIIIAILVALIMSITIYCYFKKCKKRQIPPIVIIVPNENNRGIRMPSINNNLVNAEFNIIEIKNENNKNTNNLNSRDTRNQNSFNLEQSDIQNENSSYASAQIICRLCSELPAEYVLVPCNCNACLSCAETMKRANRCNFCRSNCADFHQFNISSLCGICKEGKLKYTLNCGNNHMVCSECYVVMKDKDLKCHLCRQSVKYV